MALVRLLCIGALIGTAALGAAVPQVLIVQIPMPVVKEQDPNLPFANRVAAEFDENGKLQAVVASLTDPVFRQAAFAGKVKELSAAPTSREAIDAARKLGAEYALTVQAFRDGARIRGKVELFRGGRSIWKDDQNMAVQIGSDAKDDDALRSLARTLVVRMSADPLKALPGRPKIESSDPVPGQAPPKVDVQSAPVVLKKDHTLTLDQARALQREGKFAMAIALLRDAIDLDPLAPELRQALVAAMMQVDPLEAAETARGAALLFGDDESLRLLAARAYRLAGKADLAQNALNEAIARNPDSAETRILIGEVALADLKPERAVEHLDAAIKIRDTAQARFLRAFAYALRGQQAEMRADLAALEKLGASTPAEISTRYDFFAPVLDQSLSRDSDEARSLIQRAIVRRDEKAVIEAIGSAQRLIRARALFAEAVPAPEKFKAVHEQRLLAYRLMVQCLDGVLSFLGGGGEDALAGARIDLGEAIRNLTEARAAETAARG